MPSYKEQDYLTFEESTQELIGLEPASQYVPVPEFLVQENAVIVLKEYWKKNIVQQVQQQLRKLDLPDAYDFCDRWQLIQSKPEEQDKFFLSDPTIALCYENVLLKKVQPALVNIIFACARSADITNFIV